MRAIDMQGVNKSFAAAPDAILGADWTVETGSIHGLIGANGAGKTTLLRLALGVLWPDAGHVTILGHNLTPANAPDIRQRVVYVGAGTPAPIGWRVGDWVRYVRQLYHGFDGDRATRLLTALDVDRDKVIAQLSTGQQASLAITLAVSVRPDLLLLDEPTNGLDVVVRHQMHTLLMEMAAEEGTTVVLATHTLEDVERMTDTTTLLYQGRVVLQEELDSLKGRLHRLQVVMPGVWPERFTEDPRITATEHRGHVALITVDGPVEPHIAAFRAAGALLVEPVEMGLEEVVRSLLEREGYTRESVRWTAP